MRNLGLDLLRIVAVFLVLGRHLRLPDDANIVLQTWQRGGWVGVDLFFVLSGFLVSSLMFREHQRYGSIDLKRFLVRRAFKIYPAFWVFLAFSICMQIVCKYPPSMRALLGELLFLQNYIGYVLLHTWSLAVEEHFYLGIAVLFGFWAWHSPKHNFSAIPLIFMIVSLLCFFLRLLNFALYPDFRNRTHVFGTHIRIDSLFYGVMLSYFYNFRDLEHKLALVPTWLFFATGALLLSPAFIFEYETHHWIVAIGFILFYIGSGFVLIGALRFAESNSAPLNFVGVLGAASYSIYLWHVPVNIWGCPLLSKITGWNGFLFYFGAYIIGSCMFGLAMSRLIEIPVLRMRDFFFPSVTNASCVSRESVGQAAVQTNEPPVPGRVIGEQVG